MAYPVYNRVLIFIEEQNEKTLRAPNKTPDLDKIGVWQNP
jgi:hypothetical protein